MDTTFILVVVALSSVGVALVAVRGRPHRRFGSAVGKALETAGLAAAFLLLNLGLGFCLALLVRAVAGSFVSLYVNDDAAIVVLSVLQALVFQSWREEEKAG